MADVRVVVIEAEELQRLIAEAVRAATSRPASADEWVDARTSGLGRRTFLRLVREGEFPASKRGKAYVVRRADVDAYLERQRIAPPPTPSPPPEPPRAPDGAPFDPIAAALAEGRLRIVKKPP
jgi:excisionase family DNA binding protein